MKDYLFLVLLLSGANAFCQCPDISVSLAGGHCTGDTLRVKSSGPPARIDWYNNGQLVRTVISTLTTAPVTVVAGDNGLGSAANQLWEPNQIYVDDKDTLYVADQSNWRIQKFPPGSTSATDGKTVVQTIAPVAGVTRDNSGNLYVEMLGSKGIPDVEKWAPGATSGIEVATLTHTGTNTNLWAEGPILIDAAGNLYLDEAANNRIQKWAPGATSGVTIAGGNGPGAAANQLNGPRGFCMDKAGNLYIADALNNRIQKWAPGATSGTTVAGGNGAGSAANQLNDPVGVGIDANGNLYIADTYNYRVQEWPAGATKGITVAGANGSGDGIDQLNAPVDIFVDNKGAVYIADYINSRILKLIPTQVYSIDTTLIADVPGTYTAVVVSQNGCTLTTNPITVLPVVQLGMSIDASPNPVCASDSAVITATPSGAAYDLTYQWTVNGMPIAESGPVFTDRKPSDGDIQVKATDTMACATTVSGTVALQVLASPSLPPEESFSMPYGGSVILKPAVTGEVSSYAWSPPGGLSDTTIEDPIATPVVTTRYLLRATASDGCVARGEVTVDVFIPLRIPNAFSPNGDGKNDVFYVLGGPPGVVIKELAVFDRWGQRVFQVHDAAAGDPAFGWDGRIHGSFAAPGTYVYIISVKTADGARQTFRGTLEMIR